MFFHWQVMEHVSPTNVEIRNSCQDLALKKMIQLITLLATLAALNECGLQCLGEQPPVSDEIQTHD